MFWDGLTELSRLCILMSTYVLVPYIYGLVALLDSRIQLLALSISTGVFSLVQAVWRFAFGTTQVWQIITLIIWVIFVIPNIQHQRQISNPCKICFPQFSWWLESFHWEANWGASRWAGKRSKWMSRAPKCRLIDWIVCWQSSSHSRCTWRQCSFPPTCR